MFSARPRSFGQAPKNEDLPPSYGTSTGKKPGVDPTSSNYPTDLLSFPSLTGQFQL